jgi:purine-binding chemotaxis protein CheW
MIVICGGDNLGNSFVIFNINEQTMAMDMLNIERIIRLPKISPVPNSQDYLEGVIEIENLIVPVINLKKIFLVSPNDVLPDSNIIIIAYENKKTGVIVDFIHDMVEINEAAMLKAETNKYVCGVVKVDKKIVNVLDSKALILHFLF